MIVMVLTGWLLQAGDTGLDGKPDGWKAQADSLHQAGLALSDRGDDSSAVVRYEEALELYEARAGNPDQLLGLLYNDLAYSYGNLYVPYYSLDYFRKAVEIWESIELDDDGVDNLISGYQNLTFELIGYGDLKAADTIRKRMNSRFYGHYDRSGRPSHTDPSYRTPRSMHLLGNVRVLAAQGHLETAYAYVDTMHREIDDLGIVLAAYKILFDNAYEQGDDSLTVRFAQQALPIADRYDSPFYRLVCYAKLATVYHRMEQYEQALTYVIRAEQSMVFDSFSASKYAVQTIKAMILSGMDRWEEAQRLVEASIGEIVRNQADRTIPLAELTAADLGDLSSYTFIRVLTESSRILYDGYRRDGRKETFRKAANLYRASAGMFNRYYLKGEYTDLIDGLHLEIMEGLLTLSMDEPEGAVDYLSLIEQNASQHLIREFEKKLRVKQESQGQDVAQAFDVRHVLATLEPEESMVKFHVASEYVYRTRITADGVTVFRVARVDSLKSSVFRYATALRGLAAGYEQLSDSLRRVLLGDRAGNMTTLIPDNFLNYIPFESLYDTRLGKFIGETQAISYAYSLPVWLLHRQASFPALDAVRLGVFSPSYQVNDLRHAREEAGRVAAIFGGDRFISGDATKRAFLDRQADYDVLHFAMHSFFYEDDFSESCLVFNGAEKLYFSELHALHIPARMAVLSACNTGNGKLVKGEGVMSLSRAFAYAGVASTVVSLWQAPDKETAEIMTSFYEGIAQGLTKSSAMAQAKRAFIENNPMKRHPFFWAGFVVNGDDSPLVVPRRQGMAWMGVGVGLVLAILVSLGFVSRKRLQPRQ